MNSIGPHQLRGQLDTVHQTFDERDQTDGRCTTGDTGIHYFITVSLLLDVVFEQRNPRLLGISSVAATQGIADHDDGLAGSRCGRALNRQ